MITSTTLGNHPAIARVGAIRTPQMAYHSGFCPSLRQTVVYPVTNIIIVYPVGASHVVEKAPTHELTRHERIRAASAVSSINSRNGRALTRQCLATTQAHSQNNVYRFHSEARATQSKDVRIQSIGLRARLRTSAHTPHGPKMTLSKARMPPRV